MSSSPQLFLPTIGQNLSVFCRSSRSWYAGNTEVNRDEYSVQLHKTEAEDALVQIDIFYKKIIFRGQGPKVVYPILSALEELPSAAEEAGETSTNDD